MEQDQRAYDDSRPRTGIGGIGLRLWICIVAVFLGTLIVFVGLDVRHESSVLARFGATPADVRAVRAETLRLHAVHALVTIVAFAVGVYLIVHVLLTRRIRAILLAVHHFRLGTWRVKIPPRAADELEWLAEAFRQLGPHLERTIGTFVECDRKATVARVGRAYERVLAPLARRLLTLGRIRAEQETDDWIWPEVVQTSMRMLAALGSLGRPEHPAVADIVGHPAPGLGVSAGVRTRREDQCRCAILQPESSRRST